MNIKKCPFCGSTVELFSGYIAGLTMIVCNGADCRATVSFGGGEEKKEAVKRYNRRCKNAS